MARKRSKFIQDKMNNSPKHTKAVNYAFAGQMQGFTVVDTSKPLTTEEEIYADMMKMKKVLDEGERHTQRILKKEMRQFRIFEVDTSMEEGQWGIDFEERYYAELYLKREIEEFGSQRAYAYSGYEKNIKLDMCSFHFSTNLNDFLNNNPLLLDDNIIQVIRGRVRNTAENILFEISLAENEEKLINKVKKYIKNLFT